MKARHTYQDSGYGLMFTAFVRGFNLFSGYVSMIIVRNVSFIYFISVYNVLFFIYNCSFLLITVIMSRLTDV